MKNIFIISPNSPPFKCGVGDHSVMMAECLKEAGYQVDILSKAELKTNSVGFKYFNLIKRITNKPNTVVILQYVPNLYGRYGLNGWLVLLLFKLKINGIKVVLIAHEVVFGEGFKKIKYFPISTLQTIQIRIITLLAKHTFVSTVQGQLFLKRLLIKSTLLFTPSNFFSDWEILQDNTESNGAIKILSFGISKSRNSIIPELISLLDKNNILFQWTILHGETTASIDFFTNKNLVYLPFLPRKDIQNLFVDSDIIFHEEGGNGGVSTKSGIAASAFASGKVLLGSIGSMNDDLIFLDKQNCLLAGDNINEWFNSINFLYCNRTVCHSLGNAAKNTYNSFSSWTVLKNKIIDSI